jgi:hypothetical protein
MDVFIGAAIAGLFGLAGLLYQQTRSHRNWLRDAPYTAYADLLAVIQQSYQSLGDHAANVRLRNEGITLPRPESGPVDHAWAAMKAAAAVNLLGPQTVADAAAQVGSASVAAQQWADRGEWPDRANDPNHLMRPLLLAEQDFLAAAGAALKVGFN